MPKTEKIAVRVDASQWSASDHGLILSGGVHEVDADPALRGTLEDAAAAGVIKIGEDARVEAADPSGTEDG